MITVKRSISSRYGIKMREPGKWTEADLLELIVTKEKESLFLEYKSCDALAKTDGKKNEVSKDVSAFANSAGGTIIYGMAESKEDKHVPIKIDEGFDKTDITKEWLEQVINSRIQRCIDGIIITQVELTTHAPGRVAYIVYIPQSFQAPHQAHDKHFYKRFNFEVRVMEEYELRDAANRQDVPDLSIKWEINTDKLQSLSQISLIPLIYNISDIPANHVVVKIYIDSMLKIGKLPHDLRYLYKDSFPHPVLDQSHPCTVLNTNHSIPTKMPIFQGDYFELIDRPITIQCTDIEQDVPYLVGWTLASPRMAKVSSSMFLVFKDNDCTLLTVERIIEALTLSLTKEGENINFLTPEQYVDSLITEQYLQELCSKIRLENKPNNQVPVSVSGSPQIQQFNEPMAVENPISKLVKFLLNYLLFK